MGRRRTPDSDSLAHRIAREVSAEMARQGITQTALAEQLGWHQRSVSRRLTGDLPFDVADLEAIATALRVPVTQFLGEQPAVQS